MKHTLTAALLVTSLLSACSQERVASLVDKSNSYYGRNGAFENGQAIPRYSDYNRANQGEVAYKYKSEEHTYGVDAGIEKVEANDLPPPTANPPVAESKAAPFNAASAEPSEAPAVATAEPAKAQPSTQAPINGANLAFRWPVNGQLVSRFGPKTNGLSNDGVNIAANTGDPIWAAADGEVVYVGSELEGYGNLLILRHKDGWMTSYAHAKEFLLTKGDTVVQGDVLGYVGNSGSVKTPQLHFSMREGKTPIDPESVLGQQVAAAKP